MINVVKVKTHGYYVDAADGAIAMYPVWDIRINTANVFADKDQEYNMFSSSSILDEAEKISLDNPTDNITVYAFARIRACYRNGECVKSTKYEDTYTVSDDDDKLAQSIFNNGTIALATMDSYILSSDYQDGTQE